MASLKKKDKYVTDAELAEWRRIFNLFDTGGKGHITYKDLGRMLRALGKVHSDENLKNMIRRYDTNKNGTLEFNEFVTLMQLQKHSSGRDADIKETFKVFDKNNDGYISKEELRAVMIQMGQRPTMPEVEEMIKEFDVDGDGRVSFEEFVAMMNSTI